MRPKQLRTSSRRRRIVWIRTHKDKENPTNNLPKNGKIWRRIHDKSAWIVSKPQLPLSFLSQSSLSSSSTFSSFTYRSLFFSSPLFVLSFILFLFTLSFSQLSADPSFVSLIPCLHSVSLHLRSAAPHSPPHPSRQSTDRRTRPKSLSTRHHQQQQRQYDQRRRSDLVCSSFTTRKHLSNRTSASSSALPFVVASVAVWNERQQSAETCAAAFLSQVRALKQGQDGKGKTKDLCQHQQASCHLCWFRRSWRHSHGLCFLSQVFFQPTGLHPENQGW